MNASCLEALSKPPPGSIVLIPPLQGGITRFNLQRPMKRRGRDFRLNLELAFDAIAQDKHFTASETPCFLGRAVAALAADPNVAEKTGGAFSSWDLSEEYGFTDIDGGRPHWGRYFAEIEPELPG